MHSKLSMTMKDGKEFCSCLLGFVSTKNYMTAEMYNFFSISVSIGRQFCLLAIARNSGLDCWRFELEVWNERCLLLYADIHTFGKKEDILLRNSKQTTQFTIQKFIYLTCDYTLLFKESLVWVSVFFKKKKGKCNTNVCFLMHIFGPTNVFPLKKANKNW